MATIKREGLTEYMQANYKKEGAKAIAERFTCSASFIRAKAWKMGLKTQQRKPADTDKNGVPTGYSDKDFVRKTAQGKIYQQGAVMCHKLGV